jgi:hypothetical protein
MTRLRRQALATGAALCALSACDLGSAGPPLFEISPDGVISVTTRTSGDPLDLDSTGYHVVIDTLVDLAVGTDTTVELTVRGGVRDVVLDSIQENCAVVGDNPVKAEISIFESNAPIVFEVACDQLGGTIRVVTTTTGSQPDPDGYIVTVDGADATAVAASGEAIFPTVRPGTHVVELSGIDEPCATTENPRPVEVTHGTEAVVSFDLVCEPPASS